MIKLIGAVNFFDIKSIALYQGAGLLLLKFENGKINLLLGKRAISPHKGVWSVPGGKLSRNDKGSLWETACRETAEECFDNSTLIKERLKNASALCSSSIWIPGVFKYKTYVVDVSSKNLIVNHNWEFKDLKWFDINNLPERLHLGVKYTLWICRRKIYQIIDSY